jgi:amino acid permease
MVLLSSNNVLNAFILNAIATSLIAVSALGMEEFLKSKMDKEGERSYSKMQRFSITFFTTITAAFIIYLIMYFFFGFGSAMVSEVRKSFY